MMTLKTSLFILLSLSSLASAAKDPRKGFLDALQALKAQRFSEAQPLLEAAVKADPKSVEATFYLGQCLYHEGRLDLAQQRLLKALAMEPTLPPALYYLGRIAYDQNKLSDAFEFLRQADQAAPDLVMVHYYLGLVYQRNQQHLPAELEFQRALELDPSLQKATQALKFLRKDVKLVPTPSKKSDK